MKVCNKLFLCTIFCMLFATGTGRASDPSLILSDDFSGNLTDNWIPGMAADQNGTHALSIEDGELVWVQQYDYIESKALFGNNLKVEFDYRAGPGSIQAGEFWVELVALTDAGEYRRYLQVTIRKSELSCREHRQGPFAIGFNRKGKNS
jgi:hypothetical protein